MSTEATCNICIEPFTKQLRKKVTCPSCEESTCSQCVKRYITESINNDPKCPHCNHAWSHSFLYTVLTKAFMKGEYAAHRANILWSREESYLPQYQLELEAELAAEKYKHDIIDVLERKRQEIEVSIQNAYREYYTMFNGIASAATAGAKKFTRKCNVPDCRGWVSSSWKCGLCDNYTCNDCFAIIGEHRKGTPECMHTCTEDDIATAKIIRESTRPCPKCGEGIEKQDGCDMMFCTSCHTPFSWKTGAIVDTGRIHNPHYYEWVARTGGKREHGDIPCGGIPNVYGVTPLASDKDCAGLYYKCLSLHRLLNHVADVELDRFNNTLENRENTKKIMMDYLKNTIDKNTGKTRLQQIEVKKERARQLYDTFQTFVTIGSEYMRRICDIIAGTSRTSKKVEIEGVITSFTELIEYINGISNDISVTHNIMTPRIRKYTKDKAALWRVVMEGGSTAASAAASEAVE